VPNLIFFPEYCIAVVRKIKTHKLFLDSWTLICTSMQGIDFEVLQQVIHTSALHHIEQQRM